MSFQMLSENYFWWCSCHVGLLCVQMVQIEDLFMGLMKNHNHGWYLKLTIIRLLTINFVLCIFGFVQTNGLVCKIINKSPLALLLKKFVSKPKKLIQT